MSRSSTALLSFWLLFSAIGQASIESDGVAKPVYFLKKGETILLETREPLFWQRLEPDLSRGYDNTLRPPFDPIVYRSSRPRRAKDLRFHASKPGTYYVAASKERFPTMLSDTDALHRKYEGRVIQIVVRDDDSYLSYLAELQGTPFVMAPGVPASGYHQTDQRVGSDCAAFATYGQRRLGNRVPYGGPRGILHSLNPLIPGELPPPQADGVYRQKEGSPIPVGGEEGLKPGDIIHFGAQVSVFFSDRGKPGILDSEDLLFQSWGKTPHQTSIKKSGFAHLPIRIFRWKQ